MTIIEFLRQLGCPCFDAPAGPSIALRDGTRVSIHPGIACHTLSTVELGYGPRPRIARRRRPWLRFRRRCMRRHGRPPGMRHLTSVWCRGCGTSGDTYDRLEGAF